MFSGGCQAKFSRIFQKKSANLSLVHSSSEKGKCARASCLSGESPDFSTNESLMTYQGFGAGGLAVPSDFPSAAMQCFSIRVAEFELDMLTVCLDGFAADAEFLRDLSNTVFGCDQRKHRHLAIAKDIEAGWRFATTGKPLHRDAGDCSTGVDFARQHSLNRVH